MSERYLLDFFAVILLIFAPWWLFAFSLIAGTFIFKGYYEIAFLFCLYDLIYAHGSGKLSYALAGTIFGVAVFIVVQMFKINFNLHEKKVREHW